MPQGSSAVRPTNGLYLLPHIHTHTHTYTHTIRFFAPSPWRPMPYLTYYFNNMQFIRVNLAMINKFQLGVSTIHKPASD